MSDMVWSEQELANAAKCVAESMLASFPSPRECEHAFSDDFEHSMEILRKKSRRRAAAHKIWQRIAVIFLVTVLSVSTWLTVDIQARERAFQWIKEVYESITVYLFHSEDNEIDHICYEPSWIPEGFSLVDTYQDSDYCLRVYASDTGEEMFSVEYTLMQHTGMSTTAQEYSQVVKVDINGLPADLYIGNEASPENALLWVDEAHQVVFTIQGNISTQDIVHIARSLILSIPTKS